MKVLWYKGIVRVRGNAVSPVEEHYHEETVKQSVKSQVGYWGEGSTAEVYAIGLVDVRRMLNPSETWNNKPVSTVLASNVLSAELIAKYENVGGEVKEATDEDNQ